MLSGGLDSSSVLVTLDALRRAGRVPAAIDAYAWEFDTPDLHDDRPYRRAIEQQIGRKSFPIDPQDAGPFVRRAMTLDAAPCFDIPCPLWLALDSTARQHGVDRILTGLGGDNVLDGQPWLLGQLFLRGKPWAAVRKAGALKGFGDGSSWTRIHYFVLRPLARALVPQSLRSARSRFVLRRRFDWMGPRFRSWVKQRDGAVSLPRITLDSTPAERYAILARMPFLGMTTRIRSQHEEVATCRRVDPLFDDELLRFVATLPPLALLAGDSRRGLLRESMADRLPNLVATRPWKAYMEPALVRMVAAAGGFATFKELARVQRLADLGLVRPRPFDTHFRRLSERPLDPLWWTVWPALAAEEFLRQYDEGWLTS
jgi:asparagine synthetase B (glutamine-hydrolysing)